MDKKMLKMAPAIWRLAFLDKKQTQKPYPWSWNRARELMEVINNILSSLGKEPVTTEDLIREYPFITPYLQGESETCYWSVASDGTIHSTSTNAYDNWLHEMVRNDRFLPAGIGALFIEAIKDPIGSQRKKLEWMIKMGG